jgi:hypothetical protein
MMILETRKEFAMFIITNKGKKYRIGMREAYKKNITSEHKLLIGLNHAANTFNEPIKTALLNKIAKGEILEVCNYLGIINYSKPLNNRKD